MNSSEILRSYALLYISEKDDLTYNEKLNRLNTIKNSNEDDLIELYLLGDIRIFGEAIHLDKEASIKALKSLYFKTQRQLNNMKVKGGFRTEDLPVKKKLLDKMAKIQRNIDDIKGGVKAAAKGAGETVKDVASSAGETVKAAGKAVKDTATDVAGKAAEVAQSGSGNVALAAVAAAAIITAGVIAYKKFLSKGARACKNAPDKSQCMKELKRKAISARVQAMESGKGKCNHTKNPEKCKAKIDQKIAALKTKIAGVK